MDQINWLTHKRVQKTKFKVHINPSRVSIIYLGAVRCSIVLKFQNALWILEIMTSFKGYANDVENERFNVESMCSFKEKNVFPALNIWFLHPKDLFKSI